MQSPVTPFTDDFSLDLPTFERLLDFHVRTGATTISWPHHKGESLSLTIAERKLFAEAAVRVVNGRIPVTIHVSALAVEDTMELARHAQKIGADGILAITPYFWTPSLPAIEAYFVRLCSVIELPVLSYNSPSYLAGVVRRCRAQSGHARDGSRLRRAARASGWRSRVSACSGS
jgi:dihydrodipicolinate synthase/N-acetylneuraminate lyase